MSLQCHAALLPKISAFFLNALHEQFQLPRFPGRLAIHLNDLVNFRDGKPKSLAAQNLLHQMAIGRTEQSRTATSHRSDQALIFIKKRKVRVEIPNSRVSSVIV